MQHPYQILKPEYENLLSTMRVLRPLQIDKAARRLLQADYKARYLEVSAAMDVPATLIAALDLREDNADPRCGLGQGDPWNKVSVHVPKGKGPFPSWSDAAKFYIEYDHLNDRSVPDWVWSYVCWKGEAWNGFGPRNHGVYTGYLWGGTNHYDRGKYVRDGVWDPQFVDTQLGIIPLMMRMVALDPQELLFDPMSRIDHAGTPPDAPLPVPATVGGGTHDARWLQDTLNRAYLPNGSKLVVDGSFGRRTREAVRSFQRFNKLVPDGLFGPATDMALTAMANNTGSSSQ